MALKLPEFAQSKEIENFFAAALPFYTFSEARFIFKALAQRYWQWPDQWFLQNSPIRLSNAQEELLRNWLVRLRKQEPYQYVLGSVPFAELEINVSPAALIPRPETEELLFHLRQRSITPGTALDIGTGTGCLALGIKNFWPSCEVSGWDISEEALLLAAQNGRQSNLEVSWECYNVLEDHRQSNQPRWDIVISNPPYVTPSERWTMEKQVLHYEPNQALFAPVESPLIFYEKIAAYAQKSLSKNGILAFELNQYYPYKIAEMVEQQGFSVNLEKDMAGNWRFLWARHP